MMTEEKKTKVAAEKSDAPKSVITSESDNGLNNFPERRGEKKKTPFWRVVAFGEGRDEISRMKCERKLFNVIHKSPIVKLMLSAIENSNCSIDYRRHFACEECEGNVNGGYDPIMNQVVICQNACKVEGVIQSVLAHELIHMYDHCRAHMNWRNLDHLACTEIRAANITHCSFMSALSNGTASPGQIAKQHAECVKKKALDSIMAARSVDKDTAMSAINRVFNKCYNDLSPVGRRIRRNSHDMENAYRDRYLYGIYDF